jgi:hypothetical protein
MPVSEPDGDPWAQGTPADDGGNIFGPGASGVAPQEAPSTLSESGTASAYRRSPADEAGGVGSLSNHFDPQWKDPFEGLLFLGKLEKTVTVYGHRFRIRTLTTDEVLEVAMLSKPYIGSMGEMKAYQAALVAAAVVEVDGVPMPRPVVDHQSEELRARFNYARLNWYPPIFDALYDEFMLLEAEQIAVLERLGEASG